MKTSVVILLLMCILQLSHAQYDLSYYLPPDLSYDPSVPTPESVIGHKVGEWHVTHDKLLQYMQTIATVSDRAILVEYARSYENRPLVHLIFTSAENQNRLEELRILHNNFSDPYANRTENENDVPIVVTLGYSVHGNESSAANSALLTAYYLAAAQGEAIDNMLDRTIVLVDPSLNPDGLTRHSTWVNMHSSASGVTDPNNRGFNEVWPGGRTNHYWFDLNRDYLLLTNPESRGRVEKFHHWKPNIMTDHHEMNANSTFFFQPGIPSRNNPWTPVRNYELTHAIASHHAEALDAIGSLYFSEEVFDDFYYGKGSAYPDVNGCVGILFEQAGFRGKARETIHGIKTFPFAIRNQFTVTLSTLEASQNLKSELLEMQRDFYASSLTMAKQDATKALIFGDSDDKGRTYLFLDILRRQQIKVHKTKTELKMGDNTYPAGNSYVIPLEQPQYRLIKAMFEKVTEYKDSSFYDVSTWTMPLSFNIPYAEISSLKVMAQVAGEVIHTPELVPGKVMGKVSQYAYLFRWNEYYSPRILYKLQEAGLRVKVATKPFHYKDQALDENFRQGTILVPVEGQVIGAEEIYALLERESAITGVDVFPVSTGLTPHGIDLGSGSFSSLEIPQILMFVGNGISSRDAGEIWHQFDQRYAIPITLADVNNFNRLSLDDYNVIILAGSPDNISERQVISIKTWLGKGGVLIPYKSGNGWIVRNGLAEISFKAGVEFPEGVQYQYADRSRIYSINSISGGIFKTKLDLTHPIAFGYTRKILPVFKTGSSVAERSENPFAFPVLYTEDPLMSGFASKENIERLQGEPYILINSSGRGRIISFFDNAHFRGVWYGTNKIFANAVFFGQILR